MHHGRVLDAGEERLGGQDRRPVRRLPGAQHELDERQPVALAGLALEWTELVVIAIAGGATVLSHVNDSGFWLVGRLMGMDTMTTLKTWTVNQVLISVIGFALVLVMYGAAAAF